MPTISCAWLTVFQTSVPRCAQLPRIAGLLRRRVQRSTRSWATMAQRNNDGATCCIDRLACLHRISTAAGVWWRCWQDAPCNLPRRKPSSGLTLLVGCHFATERLGADTLSRNRQTWTSSYPSSATCWRAPMVSPMPGPIYLACAKRNSPRQALRLRGVVRRVRVIVPG